VYQATNGRSGGAGRRAAPSTTGSAITPLCRAGAVRASARAADVLSVPARDRRDDAQDEPAVGALLRHGRVGEARRRALGLLDELGLGPRAHLRASDLTTAERKRQREFIAFLEYVDREIAPDITRMHVVLDTVRMHKGKQVQAWLANHPRFVFAFPPVHCSWMNQVEQWFSILQRKRLRIADFADKQHLAQRLMAFVEEWNEHAHPFQWSTKSVAKVMAKCETPMAQAA